MVKNRQKWPTGGLEPGGRNQKTKAYVCYHKTKLLAVITYPPTVKINPDNTVYTNVSEIPPPLNKNYPTTFKLLRHIIIDHRNF